MNRELNTFLDASRWIAAFLVVISHVRHLLLSDYANISTSSLPIKTFYFATGFGSEAVVIFFVISGFLVGGSTWKKWKDRGPAPADYLGARFARIYTVLMPALFFSTVLDLAGAYWFDSSKLYSQPEIYHTISMIGAPEHRINITTFLGNLLLLQNIAVPVLGTNGPLWSLAFEWWYYTIFFIVAMGCIGSTSKRTIVCGALLVILAWLLPLNLLVMGSLWLIGAILFFVVRSARKFPHPLIGLCCFLAAMTWARLSHNVDNMDHPESIFASLKRDLIVAVGYSVFACSVTGREAAGRFSHVHRKMAEFSYSVYLVHFPMMVFVAAILSQTFGMRFVQLPSVPGLICVACMTVFLYAYAFVFASLTESHTPLIRKWIQSKL